MSARFQWSLRLLRRSPCLVGPARQQGLQELPRIAALDAHHGFGAALGDDLAAAVAAFGAEVQDPVGRLDDVEIVLDHHDRVSCVHQSLQDLQETLEVVFKGKSISDVLDMTVDEAAELFKAVPAIRDKMETLKRVGLGYIHVGQQATTLSGGEAQRVKLARELSRRATGRTLYILDEPTTGLHAHDVAKLLEVLHELVEQGNTVVVIEHNLDVIKTADWILDFGPEGGDGGGRIVATGTPEEVADVQASYTGQYLRPHLARTGQKQRKRA